MVSNTFIEYNLKCVVPRAIKSPAYADLLAIFPSGTFEPPHEEFPGDKLQANYLEANLEGWNMEFDGSLAESKGGAGVILRKGEEEVRSPFKLDLSYSNYSNNEAEYEALVLGMLKALRRGIHVLTIKGDSNLVVKQVNGEYALKHMSLAP